MGARLIGVRATHGSTLSFGHLGAEAYVKAMPGRCPRSLSALAHHRATVSISLQSAGGRAALVPQSYLRYISPEHCSLAPVLTGHSSHRFPFCLLSRCDCLLPLYCPCVALHCLRPHPKHPFSTIPCGNGRRTSWPCRDSGRGLAPYVWPSGGVALGQ